MAPIPVMIREAAEFESQYGISWTDYGAHANYSKQENISHEFREWTFLLVVIASVLFAIIVVGIIAHFCFWGRHRYMTTILFVIARGH